MKQMLCFCAAFAATAVMGAASDLPQLDSSAFSCKYEMEILPHQEDVDGDGAYDFTAIGGSQISVAYGIATCTFPGNRYYVSQTDSGAGSVWRKFAPAAGEGYTIELRMKLLSQTANIAGALTVSDGGAYDATLNFTTNNISWGGSAYEMRIDTTDAFHIYRIAKIPNEDRFVLWCDGNLASAALSDSLPNNTGLNRLIFGAIGSAFGGKMDVSYLRFTKGAYAPEQASGVASSMFTHKYEMDSSDGRFLPRATSSDWQHTVVGGGTATLSDGILSVVQPSGAPRYYKTVGTMDTSITEASPFTLEMRVRVYDRWFEDKDRVLHVLVGTPRAASNFFIGENSIQYHNNNVLHTGDNTDKMHVFRITYSGEGKTGFTMWRDDEKIGEDLACSASDSSCNYVRFGIVSSTSHGGSFDLDYIRWTTDGVFAPYVPLNGTMFLFR